MTEVHLALRQPSKHGFKREEFLKNLLLDIARVSPDVISQDIVREITLSEVLNNRITLNGHLSGVEPTDHHVDSLSDDDILRFGLSSPRYELGPKAQQRIEEELDKIIQSVAEFFHADVDWEGLDEAERDRLIQALPENIASFKASIESTRSEISTTYERLQSFLTSTSEAHARLRSDLSSLIAKHPPKLNERRAASTELLAARIEASIIKLSLLGARAKQALYDHRSTKHPDASVAQALSTAYTKLRTEEKKMREEAGLDRQLADYDMMLKLVDGSEGGGFRQVIEDWTRVQREREECIRDLRRLGWTGD
ncbi:hypothetical protein H0H87_003501 [Tephrocybe sp. NHM501043]|nr:hypothetical protein H0H87_003501 [Tephrocybe sp. NHM501043]